MLPDDPNHTDATPDPTPEPRTNFARRSNESDNPKAPIDSPLPTPRHHRLQIAFLILILLTILAALAFFLTRRHIAAIMQANLPQLDGSLTVYGLSAPVTVQRDTHGVPHIHASSLEDLVFAQGYLTAQDRLWQMDLLRRHASGQLAAILGRPLLEHDRLQRTLQLRAAADRAIAILPPDEKRWLEIYANGVNASISAQREHLPVEFRLIGYVPARWTPRDSLLIEAALFQDLTTGFPDKLARETLSAHLPPELIADLYPTGSWRDHPPGQPIPDLTAPQTNIPDIPLDESQSKLRTPHSAPTTNSVPLTEPATNRVILTLSETKGKNPRISPLPLPVLTTPAADLLAINQTLALFHPPCSACVPGSNSWAISGTRTASGKPMLSNDMHLALAIPSIWYEADLQADASTNTPTPFHAAGITLPGTPFVIAGHNQHVAWGFTNLRADIQDLTIEHTRGTPTGAEYQTSTGAWRPIRYQNEIIHVRGSADVTLAVPLTQHGTNQTPLISSLYPNERRTISLNWTIYDPATLTANFLAVNTATDWPTMQAAFADFGLPLNLTYADDQGHIAYHAIGRIPIRGDIDAPTPISPIPTDASAPDASTHEWVATIPFDQLPESLDPADGVLATANARITLDDYRYPITLNWMSPYRTERIYKILETPTHPLSPTDLLALQNDVFSELDQFTAQRLAYAIDHTTGPLKNDKTLHQAADILRQWNGQVDAAASAPAIINAFREAFWPMLLIPKLAPQFAPQLAQGADLSKLKNLSPDTARTANLWQIYTWGERPAVEEQLLTHTPARWLPSTYATWDDFLAAVVLRGLHDSHAPSNLLTWQFGHANPIDIEHPIFSQSAWLQRLIGLPTGTGPQPHKGDLTTVNNIGTNYGPSERFTTDLADPDRTTLNIVTGQSANPASPYFLDQFQDWLRGATYLLPFTQAATQPTITHTLTLNPR